MTLHRRDETYKRHDVLLYVINRLILLAQSRLQHSPSKRTHDVYTTSSQRHVSAGIDRNIHWLARAFQCIYILVSKIRY